MTVNTAPGPLSEVKVLDLTAMLAGPFTTMLLADLGADVVKVEPPSGDRTRGLGPHRPGDDPEQALGGYFQSVNRGKRSVVLDLKSEAGAAEFLKLVKVADVVVENFSAGVMERFGLSYEVLAAVNPRLVYAALRGFGDTRSGKSPYENWPAFDVVAQAMGGFAGITGPLGGPPLKSGPGIGDIFPGTLLALGVAAAVRHAERTGEGQFVDVAMYDAVLALCERLVYQHSYEGIVPRPMGNGHPLLAPFDIMQTLDGWVAVAAPSNNHWRILAETMQRPDLVTDPHFIDNTARVANIGELREVLGGWLSGRSTAAVVDALGGRVPIGPVNDAADIFADEHVRLREMLVEVEQPGSATPVTIAGSPIKFSSTPSGVRGRGPKLGEQDPVTILSEWSAGQHGQDHAPTSVNESRQPETLVGPWGWFEDFHAGQQMRHYRAATMGEIEGSGPAKQVMNTAQAHFNDHFLKGSTLGDERLVFGLATASMVYGLASQDTAEHAVAELGWSQLRFRAPVHHGDTIEAFTEVVSVEPGPDDHAPGKVVFRHWGRKQDGVIVFEGERSALIRRRQPTAP